MLGGEGEKIQMHAWMHHRNLGYFREGACSELYLRALSMTLEF